MKYKTDILVIGSGVAGLTFAAKMAEKRPDLKITIITKNSIEESNTKYAQGGIATVWNLDKDNYKKHIADTMDAGDDLNDPEVVKMVISEGPKRVRELIEWGARFDKKVNGDYELGREGGHSENRVLHYKDITGWEVERSLIERVKSFDNIEVFENHFALELITQHHLGRIVLKITPGIKCFGAYVLDNNTLEVETILAKTTVLTTGGSGQLYRLTTNPKVATGDGIAMMYRAKGRIANMEFVQFHPTALYESKDVSPNFLISEAVRGHGGILKNKDGSEFMQKYDERGSLAPRDIVARAIDNEMKIHGTDHVYLDVRHIEKSDFIKHFPNIYEKCLSIGIDAMKEMIPVAPACHYFCGGVVVDMKGRTSIGNLYAAGEVTYSGLHGANRLASNSLLEGLVYAHNIHLDISNIIDEIEINNEVPEWDATGTREPKEMILITQSLKEIRDVMGSYVGIVRNNIRLQRAMNRIMLYYKETEDLYKSSTLSRQLCELRNLITIGYLVTKSSQLRHESRGLNYNTDYPDKLPYNELTLI
ncbi:MAG TPA: L-aspartate oxidase [Bacteroidetes bacterium]|nr:L-aspartate oxidase [Bacteroidota bacterium]